MEVLLRVRIWGAPKKLVASVADALGPDNAQPGKHLKIVDGLADLPGGSAEYFMEMRCEGWLPCINSVRGTLDEVLALVEVLRKVSSMS